VKLLEKRMMEIARLMRRTNKLHYLEYATVANISPSYALSLLKMTGMKYDDLEYSNGWLRVKE